VSRGESRKDETTLNPLIYLVDDDGDFRDMIIRGLIRLGLDVQGFQDAPALYRAYAVRRADIVILDVGLSGEDGLAIAAHLRSSGPVGIIMATGRSSIEDRVEGLHRGADAYLVKPVDIRELGATVFAVNRRARAHRPVFASPAPHWALVGGGWVLSDGLGHRLALTESERCVLALLFKERGRPVERDAIVEALGEDIHEFDHSRLHVIVCRLRRRAEKASMRLPLHAVRGMGFCFADDAAGARSALRME